MAQTDLSTGAGGLDLAVNDLGPLAWVLDELRKSLDSAGKALKRFVRDAEMARGSDLAAVDASQLRIARQQLHQAVGALEMVGLGGPATMLRAMEGAAQRFVQRPELCTEAAASKVERASFALTEYLEGLLAGKPLSPVALFPQYRDVQELAGADRVHPADLWPLQWRWHEPAAVPGAAPLAYDASVRARLDHAVLKMVKGGAPAAAADLQVCAAGLAQAAGARQPVIFWRIAAGFFEAVTRGLLSVDVYVKRAFSRVLLQYATLAKGEAGVSDRLAHDLVFFCAQARRPAPGEAPHLEAVRAAWGLAAFQPVDYESSLFGQFDPAALAQARKRIGTAKEIWSALSGGEVNKLKAVVDQFSLVADSLMKLHPASEPLAAALTRAVESVQRSGEPPAAELAMEVATSVLFLEAVFEDVDLNDPELPGRTGRLAERLERVRGGGQPEPLEPWMEELYRRVSDRQTMGSVVGELRTTLADVEKSMDQFFRDPAQKSVMREVPQRLSQMRGVLSVLGLDQAAQAVQRMRESVEEILITELDVERARAAGTFDKLGNNLGALGFLIDMLNYQPALAKQLFVYDEANGELKPLMGRSAAPKAAAAPALQDEVLSVVGQATQGAGEQTIALRLDSLADQAALADQPDLARTAREASEAVKAQDPSVATLALGQLAASVAAPAAPPPAPAGPDIEEDDLRGIFIEEAREVVGNGLAALERLASEPGDFAEQTTLRRAFHTLKGSSRMVGLTEYGEAAWSMEQVMNAWLAEQKPITDELRTLTTDALHAFRRWIEAIERHADGAWQAAPFRQSGEAMRQSQQLLPLAVPAEDAASGVTAAPAGDAPADLALTDLSFDLGAADAVGEVADVSSAVRTPSRGAPTLDFAAPAASSGLDLPRFDLPGPDRTTSPPGQVDAPSFELPVEIGGPAADPTPDAAAAPEVDFDMPAFDLSEPASGGTPVAEPVAPSVPLTDPGADIEEAARTEASLTPDAGPVFDLDFDAPVPEPAAVPEPVEIAGIDFDSLAQISQPPAVEPAAGADIAAEDAMVSEQVKVIGDLRIGIPLYNVYLNEADEWSRRLRTEVSEWTLLPGEPLPESAVGLAHALSGASATVGFSALAELAKSLELAMTHVRTAGPGPHARVISDATDEVHRVLHQFAAGFLAPVDGALLQRLREVRELALAPAAPPEPVVTMLHPPQVGVVPAFTAAMPAISSAAADAPAGDASGRSTDFTDPVSEVGAGSAPAGAAEPVPASVMTPQPPESPVQAASASVPAAMPTRAEAAAARAAVAGAALEDEDIDETDAIDPDLFPIFEEEAQELMPRLGAALRQWSQRPDSSDARTEVLRVLHTLKGSARLTGALRLGEMAHRLETEVEHLGSEALVAAQIEPLIGRFDALQTRFDVLRDPSLALDAGLPAPQPAGPDLPATDVAAVDGVSSMAADGGVLDRPAAPATAAPSRAIAPVRATAVAQPRAAGAQSVRVRSNLLDRLVNQAGEVMITRSRLEAELGQLRGSLADLTGNLDRLRQQLRDIELQAETQMQSRLAQARDSAAGFDPLEFDRFTRVQELTRMMAESVNDVATVQRNLQRTVEATEDDLIAQARQTRELQRDLLRTRMVEFEGISERLYRVVRQASKETAKQVKLDITGGSIEMDRGVLDRMTPAFEHLLRNCVAHGIEDPARRAATGKDPVGTITIDLRQEGNDVSVQFRDDGAGLDLDRIRRKALEQGLVAPGQEISADEAANLIFMPGFSTASEVTELAGRGIGMDVVRSEVLALGGRIETSTEPGAGTSFRLVLPLTTAVTQVVMVRSGALAIGVPANLVEIVRRATVKELQAAYNSGSFEFLGEQVPFFWSGALLQSSRRSAEPQGKTTPVVIFRSAAQRVAVHVDEVLGNQEVVVKNLGPQLARLPGLAGMTVLASGAVALIYNPVALAAVYGDQARAMSADQAQPEVMEQAQASAQVPATLVTPAVPQVPLVLVVDDSITVRRVTQRLLQREGYRVSLAADGLQALERLADERPAVVLSDIEMPRMDGFDLARNIRNDARLKDLPIVMITSRIAEKHREHARELGVDHYLGKPYAEEELLSLVRRYASAAAESVT